MANSNYDLGLYVVPKNGYKVSENTAAVVDCIRMLDALYSKIDHALSLIHGEAIAEQQLNEVYYTSWSELDTLLHEELKESIMENLISLSNTQNTEEILL